MRAERTVAPQLEAPPAIDAPVAEWSAGVVRRLFAAILATGMLAVPAVLITRCSAVVRASGTLVARDSAPVRAQMAGTVARFAVKNGDTVTRNQVVAVLDSVEVATALTLLRARRRLREVDTAFAKRGVFEDSIQRGIASDQAAARVARALASLRARLADHNLSDRVDSVLAAGVSGTHVLVDAAVADVIEAMASVNAVRAARSPHERDYARSSMELRELDAETDAAVRRGERLAVRAPQDGIVSGVSTDWMKGSWVAEGDILMNVRGFREWDAEVLVGQAEALKVDVGDSALLEIPGLASLVFPQLRGVVVEIADEANRRTTSNIQQLPAGRLLIKIRLQSLVPDGRNAGRLRPGLNVDASIVTDRLPAWKTALRWMRRSWQ